jgi:hypothetical protein
MAAAPRAKVDTELSTLEAAMKLGLYTPVAGALTACTMLYTSEKRTAAADGMLVVGQRAPAHVLQAPNLVSRSSRAWAF